MNCQMVVFWGYLMALFLYSFSTSACLEQEGLGCRVVIYFDMLWSLHNLFTLETRMRNLLHSMHNNMINENAL